MRKHHEAVQQGVQMLPLLIGAVPLAAGWLLATIGRKGKGKS